MKLYSAGVGNLKINLNDTEKPATINNITHVPNLSANLLSVSTMVNRGFVITFTEQGCRIYDKNDCEIKGNVKVTAKEEGGVYKINKATERANVAVEKSNKELWDRRLGHLGNNNLKLLRDGMATELTSLKKLFLNVCLVWKENKQGSLSKSPRHSELMRHCSSYIQTCVDPWSKPLGMERAIL